MIAILCIFDPLGLPMCTGPYRLREKSKKFKKHSKRREEEDFIQYSQNSINWLQSIEQEQNIEIRHAENNPNGEKCINNSYVDGFSGNTIYEFLGCRYHGHDCSSKYHNPKELEKIIRRLEKFQEMKYEVVRIWECQWDHDPVPTKPY